MLLIIDNYDSFTYNLAHAFGELGAEVVVRRNDAIDADGIDALEPAKIVISPAAGSCSPMIERISTDLPVPEPPTTPRISPRQTSRSRFSWMTASPKRLVRPRTEMMGWDSLIATQPS